MFKAAGQEEDHLYDFNTSMGSMQAPMSTFSKPPGTSMKFGGGAGGGLAGPQARPLQSSMGRQAPGSRGGIPGTAMGGGGGGGGGDARPMTSVSGAGFKSDAGKQQFDPLNQGNMRAAAPLAQRADNSPEDKAKEMEKGVHRLIEQSSMDLVAGDFMKALEKAKEAGKSERALSKFRDSNNLSDHNNADLTYSVMFCLANAQYYNKLYDEALNVYQTIIKNKNYTQSGRLKVNMGNIYYEQKKYPQAIKQYRMALDQTPQTAKELRLKITRNIGISFLKLGQFQDAIENFEQVMTQTPDIQTAFNLMLCYYAKGDKDKMKRHFEKMVAIKINGMSEEDEESLAPGPITDVTKDIISDRQDTLKDELTKRNESFQEKLLLAARLIAPKIDDKWLVGYQWVMDVLKQSCETVSSKLELDLAMEYLKKKKYNEAISVLKGFEKKDPTLRAMASTNLSFIYYLEGDYAQAEKQADIAIRTDRYNAKALVNKGNCLFMLEHFHKAREMYLEAVGVEADCIEAIYNLGLVNLELEKKDEAKLGEAKNAFDKLHTILPTAPEALYQLAVIAEKSEDTLNDAVKTYELLLRKVQGDPFTCVKLGQVFEKLNDELNAKHWFDEAHRYFPVNLNVISWIGVWYVKKEMYDQAIEFFERAVAVQPGEVKWRLMVTSCYRRLADFGKALELYKKIHDDFPDNLEALQYIEAICKDFGRPHEEYTRKKEKLQRSMPQSQPTQQQKATAQVQQAPQRSERPAREGGGGGDNRPSRSERPARENAPAPDRNSGGGGDDGLEKPLQAPKAGGQNNRNNEQNMNTRPNKVDDDDDFGGTDVSSYLL